MTYELIQGDCLEILKGLAPDTVDLVFADPPYHLSNGGFSVRSGRQVSVNKGDWDSSNGLDKDFEFHLSWLSEVRRVLKPNGTIFVSGTYHSIFRCGFAMEKLGYRFLNNITWFKPNAAPNLSGRMFTASNETIIWAAKSRDSKQTFNYKAMKEGDFGYDSLKNPGKQMRDVWSIPTTPKSEKSFGDHPTQKPLRLLERIVASASVPGDLVLDPFCGSGTTGLAALKLGRRFLGIEIEERFLQLTKSRIEAQNHAS